MARRSDQPSSSGTSVRSERWSTGRPAWRPWIVEPTLPRQRQIAAGGIGHSRPGPFMRKQTGVSIETPVDQLGMKVGLADEALLQD